MGKKIGIIFCTLFLMFFLVGTVSAASVKEQKIQKIKAAYCENMPPFQYTDQNQNADGMHIDILNAMAKRQNLEVEYIPYHSREECISALERKEVDVVLGYPVNGYDSKKYISTGELSKATLCMISRKATPVESGGESKPIAYSKAVLEWGTVDYAYLQSMGIKQIIATNSQERVAEALMNGQADIAVGTAESLQYILTQKGVQKQFDILHSQIAYLNYCILLNMDNQRLRAMLDTELAELRTNGEYEKIYKEWVVSQDLDQAMATIRKILVIAAIAAVIAFFVISLNVHINRMLREKVEEKTEELRYANTLLEEQLVQIQRESSLRNSIIESVPTGILFLNRDFQVTLMNPAATVMCDMTADVAVGKKINSLPVFGELIEKLEQKMILQRLQEGKPYLLELGEDAEIQKYRCWFHYLKEASGRMLFMTENVTSEELHRKERFDQEKAQVLGRLVAGIAHELKNPLMNLKTAVTLILTQGDRAEVKEAFARFIPGEVDRMNRLVEGLLNYSRPTREKPELLQLSEVVNNCLYLTRVTARGEQMGISVELDDSLLVCVQKDMLRQSLINIIINGIWSVEKKQADFPEQQIEEKAISVKVYQEDGWACLSVRDQGIGMSSKEIKRCTEPFYTTKKAGTGLGLALTKQFVEDNGGSLCINSELGKYTEIIIRFRRYAKE